MAGRLSVWLMAALLAGAVAALPARAQDTAAAGGSPGSETSSAGEGGSGGDEGPSGSDSTVGYIDPAIPMNVLRFRYDNAHGNNRPTRGTFFYAKQAPDGPGLPLPESNVDYQDLALYGEYLFGQRFSVFAELPVRFANFRVNKDQSGLADMNAGFKYAFLRDADTVGTFQWRTYVPTGDPHKGLGTSHASVEPALLLFRRLNERLASESEFHYWVPIGGPRGFESEVIRYGTGLRYNVYEGESLTVAPVVEAVGWTFLNGQSEVVLPSGIEAPVDKGVGGTTIINLKGGVRMRWDGVGDIYAGYGHALTGAVLYKEIARIELRLFY
jgi:hypothetical protein